MPTHPFNCACETCETAFLSDPVNNKPLLTVVANGALIRNYARIWECSEAQVVAALARLQEQVEYEYSAKPHIQPSQVIEADDFALMLLDIRNALLDAGVTERGVTVTASHDPTSPHGKTDPEKAEVDDDLPNHFGYNLEECQRIRNRITRRMRFAAHIANLVFADNQEVSSSHIMRIAEMVEREETAGV